MRQFVPVPYIEVASRENTISPRSESRKRKLSFSINLSEKKKTKNPYPEQFSSKVGQIAQFFHFNLIGLTLVQISQRLFIDLGSDRRRSSQHVLESGRVKKKHKQVNKNQVYGMTRVVSFMN